MDFEIRPIVEDELPAFTRAEERAFGHPPEDLDPAHDEWMRKFVELDRTLAAFDDGRIVGTAGAWTMELTLPGLAVVPTTGVTAVGVLPTHRRRGILSALMARQLDDVSARGETMAVLLASESIIYGRFGYGLATSLAGLEIDTRRAVLLRPPSGEGRVRIAEKAEALTLFPAIFDRARVMQPGQLSRPEGMWTHLMQDRERDRDGATAWMFAVHETTAGDADGYVLYRMKHDWSSGIASHTLTVYELISATPEARAALWQFCLSVDLVATVRAEHCPVDEPLRWVLADPRRLRTTRLGDMLWVRLLDVAAALESRSYSADGELVLDVHDGFRPETSGRYRLEAGRDGAAARRDDSAAPDLALGAADLGAVFLGGVRFGTLARAGRVSEVVPGALARADAMFTSDPLPFCSVDF